MNPVAWVGFTAQRVATVLVCISQMLPLATTARAESNIAAASLLTPTAAVSASARLDFALTLGSFVSLQVGSPGSTVVTVSFDLASLASPACTATPLSLCFGNAAPVAASTNGILPVIVKSNGGPVKLKATVVTALTSGANTIPMSQLLLSSSDATNLPAPILPNTGDSSWVNVAPTSFAARVTDRTANWSFAYANTVSSPAGSYSGKVMFTATAP